MTTRHSPEDVFSDATDCPVCGRDSCEDHLPPEDHRPPQTGTRKLDGDALEDAHTVATEGQQLAKRGVKHVIDGLIPDYGMVGVEIAYAKTGKTTLALAMGCAVAAGTPFLGRTVTTKRVLVIAAEDPPEYIAYLARHLDTLPVGVMTFYRRSIVLDRDGLTRIATTTVKEARMVWCSSPPCRRSYAASFATKMTMPAP